MTLAETMNGPLWILWIVIAIFALISVIFLSGHGAGLIAGYNTASDYEKSKYDEKKMCLLMGIGMSLICLSLVIMLLFMNSLPAVSTYYFLGFILFVAVGLIVGINTVCKKKM